MTAIFPGKGVFRLNIELMKIRNTVEYSGEMILMRDAAQKRLVRDFETNNKLIELKDKIVFYAGPAKKPKNSPVGAIGPTTSERMDKYLEFLFKNGVLGTVGKGKRSGLAIELCKKYRRVYFVTPSGSAAALSKCIIKHDVLLYPDLQTEAIQKIQVKDFPLYIAIDIFGNSIF